MLTRWLDELTSWILSRLGTRCPNGPTHCAKPTGWKVYTNWHDLRPKWGSRGFLRPLIKVQGRSSARATLAGLPLETPPLVALLNAG